jgi:isopenicillin N synthase-like dioxygenase
MLCGCSLLISLVFQEPQGQPGLQVYLPLSALSTPAESGDTVNNSEYPTTGNYGWFDAPVPPPGGFLVNVGLAMELWSGGIYKATLHRVIFPKAIDGEEMKDRYTFAYFVQPDDEVVSVRVGVGRRRTDSYRLYNRL